MSTDSPITPLYSLASEEALLGSLLIDPTLIRELGLTPADFFTRPLALLYSTIFQLDRSGSQIDFLSLSEALDRSGHLAEIGGPAYLTNLIQSTPTSIHAPTYAGIIRDYAGRRRLLSVANQLATNVHDLQKPVDASLTQLIGSLPGLIDTPHGAQHVSTFASHHYDRLDEISKNPQACSGIPTGFKDYDDSAGGLHNELLLVLGKPGLGKTKFVLQMAFQMAEAGYPGAVYEFETCEEDIFDREVSRRTRIPTERLERADFHDDEWAEYIQAIERLSNPKLPIWLDFHPGWTTQSLRADLLRLKAEHAIRWFVIDYLKFVSDRWGDSETDRQNYISRQLKSITRELDLAGVVIHSFNKEGLKADLPDLDNASQGADIMYDCDKALFIVDHVPEPGQLKNDCVKTFIFRKSRRKVKQAVFHLVSSPDVPDFHPLTPLSHSPN
jgi:replicative DNA helicase